MIAAHMAGLRTDDEFFNYLKDNKTNTVRVALHCGWSQEGLATERLRPCAWAA